jgi:hypothetical protein
MWQCVTCREQVEDSFDVCWKCGTSRDGTPDPNFRTADDSSRPVPALVAERDESRAPAAAPLRCPRCDRELDYMGTKAFHEGTRWGILGDLGELFVNKERLDVYRCPRCGRVEFYVDGIGEDLRPR